MTLRDNNALLLVLRLARRRAGRLLLGALALVGVDLLQLYVPRLIKFAVDDLTVGRATAASLLWQALTVLALALGMGLLRLVWRPLIMGFSRAAERDLRLAMFRRLQELELDFLRRRPPGELMARATNDLINIRLASGMGLVAALDGLVLTLSALGFMLYISPALTLLAVLPMPAIVVLTRVMSRRMHRGFLASQESFARMTELVREVLSNILLVKVYALYRREQRRLDRSARHYLEVNLDLARTLGLFFPLMVLFTNLSLAVVLGLGGPLTVWGKITPGDFVAFAAYLNLLTWPLMALGWVTSLMQRAWSSFQRVDQVISARPAIQDPPRPRRLDPDFIGPAVRVQKLSFTYPGSRQPVLREVSLEIPRQGTIVLVGPIASGKTTLLMLLARLYDPPPGSILVRGVDLRELSVAALRAHVVQVPQEAFLFSTTLRANLTLGLGEVPEDELWRALEAADLAREVRELSQGLDTPLGERGHRLSGGQRQRLTLARALLRNPPILVLDDPLSAVDTETESRILANLNRLRTGRPTLVVSHRLGSVAFARRIYVLDQGRVVEQGDHDRLMAAGGLYHRLFAEQALLAQLQGAA